MSASYTTAELLKPTRVSVCNLIRYLYLLIHSLCKDMPKQEQIFQGFILGFFFGISFRQKRVPYGRKISFLSHHQRLLALSTAFKTKSLWNYKKRTVVTVFLL